MPGEDLLQHQLGGVTLGLEALNLRLKARDLVGGLSHKDTRASLLICAMSAAIAQPLNEVSHMEAPLCQFCKSRHWQRICPTLAAEPKPKSPPKPRPQMVAAEHVRREPKFQRPSLVTETPVTNPVTIIPVTSVTKKGRGRPKSGNALSASEKQKAYRERKKSPGKFPEKSGS